MSEDLETLKFHSQNTYEQDSQVMTKRNVDSKRLEKGLVSRKFIESLFIGGNYPKEYIDQRAS